MLRDGSAVIPCGIDNEPANPEQELNAQLPILLSFVGNLNSPYNPLHPEKPNIL